MSNNIVFRLSPIVDTKGFSGRADLSVDNGVLGASFKGDNDSHVIRFELPNKVTASGVGARLKLSGWESISYAAIGYSKITGYKHIKAKNIRQNAWVDFGFCHGDIIWQLQNGQDFPADTEIKDIRLFIKGKPSAEGANLEIAELFVQKNKAVNIVLDRTQQVPVPLLDTVYGYLKKAFRNYAHQANEFMQTGKCPMPGEQFLDWELDSEKPAALDSVNTFRANWHAQHPAISLLLHAQETSEIGSVFAAKTLIDNWLGNSFYTPDQDIKYTWYDHGTAERLLAFIIMWEKGVELKLDRRFMGRLSNAIISHADLLNSEAFYAYDQPQRYHNHAWFQDAALIAAAIAFPSHERSLSWLSNAISRFEDQLDKLIVRDGGFAIFIENSIGYHHGVQRLAEFVGQLVALSDQESEIPIIAQELVAWSDFLRYPDGRAPAQGDTFRLPPRTGKDVRRGKPWPKPSCTVLSKAGYAVVKGNHEGKPWMLCMFATSLSATHKHEDNLSITFWFDGVEWLIDPSFYSHEYDQEIPKYLRSAAAHNTIYIPGSEYNIQKDKASISGCLQDDEFNIVGSHGCYNGYIVRRKIKGSINSFSLNIFDEIERHDKTINNKGFSIVSVSEAVKINEKNNYFEINSKDSEYKISLKLNGFLNSDISRGYVGLGFMNSTKVSFLQAEFSDFASFTLDLIKEKDTILKKSVEKLNKNIGLIGGCTSRDTLSLLNPKSIKYFARTSFISLVSEPVYMDESNVDINGAFEKRMILSDFDKRAFSELADAKIDFLMLDFLTERFDVIKIKKSYVTHSNYLIQSGALNYFDDYKVIMRENVHDLWKSACDKVVLKIRDFDCPVILHKAWWAEKYMNHKTGELEKFSDKELKVVRDNNKYLSEYYSYFESAYPEVICIEAPDSLIYSDFAHKWGRDFFHYSPAYYEYISSRLSFILNKNLVSDFK